MSKLEKRFYDEVVVEGMKNANLTDYKLQVKYNLQESFKYMGKTIRAIQYVSDFDLYYSDGRFEVIDTKGMATADSKIKAKLFKHKYPDIILKWVSWTKSTGWIEYDELQKIRRDKKKKEK
nr:MAG TPA: Endonuclease [Caudoviricetes sp.]